MLKRLAIVIVWLICAGVVPGQGNNDAHPKPDPAKQEQPTLHPTNGEQGRSKASDEKDKANGNTPAGNAAIERAKVWWIDSNWWLVLIAFGTACVIGWQSWETRKAAQGDKDGVGVALTQIQMMKAKYGDWEKEGTKEDNEAT